jgi:Tol biopolymer transport system component
LLDKSLRKNAGERYQSAAELLNDLRQLLQTGTLSSGPAQIEAKDGNRVPLPPYRHRNHKLSSTVPPRGLMTDEEQLESLPDAEPKRTSILTWPFKRWQFVLPILLIIGGGLYLSLTSIRRETGTLKSQKINLTFERLNLAGDIRDIVLSPDGKYVASVVTSEGQHTIHLAEVATKSDLRLVGPSEEGYSGLSFSPDGTYLYYVENHAETGTLYRTSKLGGGQRKILNNVNTSVTFSPDGSQMAFVRTNSVLDTPDLIIARPDGEPERLLARRTQADSDAFMSDMHGPSPAWSPDGKSLACPTFSLVHDREMNLEIVDAETGTGTRLNAKSWHNVSRVVWLSDGSGLVIAAAEAPGDPWQLQLISYPGGEVRKLTNDPNNYTIVSGRRDSSEFLTLTAEEDSSIWQVSTEESSNSARLAATQRKGVAEIEWNRSGGFLYTVRDGNHTNIWTDDANGAARQLTFGSDNLKSTESPDQRYIIYVSTRAGAMNIWRMNADGSQPMQLTSGVYEDIPSVTADSRWVIYRTANSIRKVSIDGGASIKLFDKTALCPVISPDGKLLAFFTNDSPESKVWHIEVYDLSAVAPIRRFQLPKNTTPFNSLRLTPDNRLRWMPDNRGLGYVSHANGASNIWLQMLAGGSPRRLTDFKDAEILSFGWSADGRELVCVRNIKAFVPILVRLF